MQRERWIEDYEDLGGLLARANSGAGQTRKRYAIVAKVEHITSGLCDVFIGYMLPRARDESSVCEGVECWAWGSLVCPVDCIVMMRLVVVTLRIELQRLLHWNEMICSGSEELVVAMVMSPGRRWVRLV